MAELFQDETGEEVTGQRVGQIKSGIPESGPSLSEPTLKQVIESGVGKDTAWKQRKLQKVRPDLYDSVVGGSMTLNAACVAAGIVKKPGPLEKILKLLPKLRSEELQQLKKKIAEWEYNREGMIQ